MIIYILIVYINLFILQKIEKPFLAAVETTLGDRYTQNVEGIYKITIKFIIETLQNGFEKGNNNSANNKITTPTTTTVTGNDLTTTNIMNKPPSSNTVNS